MHTHYALPFSKEIFLLFNWERFVSENVFDNHVFGHYFAKNDVSNLKPVSLLPLPGKPLEKCVHSQTFQYLDENNISNDAQGGFQPKAHIPLRPAFALGT